MSVRADSGFPSRPKGSQATCGSSEPAAGARDRGRRALRGIGWFVVEATEQAPPDYVLAGIEEVSTGLELVHEYLVRGPLGMFIQARLDDESGRAALAAAGELQGLRPEPVVLAARPSRTPGGGRHTARLLVVGVDRLDLARGSGGAAEALRWVEACARGRDG